MDPRLDVSGRIAELLASTPRSHTVVGADQPPMPAISATPRPGRVRTAVGGVLISAGRALTGDQGAHSQTVARR